MKHRSKLPNVGTTIFTVMSDLANKHQAINLSQGFPNFKSDQKLLHLVATAIKEGNNQYAPMLGSLLLREAIAAKFDFLYGVSYNVSNEIVVTSGATQAIFTAISAFINPQDEVLLFKPAYDCYEPTVHLNGGVVVPIQLQYPEYSVDWELVKNSITSKTRMIIINSPQNPCGTIFSKKDMITLEKITKGTDIIIVSDEVYEHMVFDNETHQSACLFSGLKERTLITASFGKTFHNTGWKLGYCCGPKELMVEFIKVHQFNVFSANHPMQLAIANYMSDTNTYTNLPQFFQQKRDVFLNAIKHSRFQFTPSKGTYFQVLDYSQITSENDIDFAKRMVIEHGLASIPLSVFNQNGYDQKVLRFCFAKDETTLLKAAKILNNM